MASLLVACAQEQPAADAVTGGPGVLRCVPGHSAACGCADGRAGAQQCGSDGTYEACVCTGAMDAGRDAQLALPDMPGPPMDSPAVLDADPDETQEDRPDGAGEDTRFAPRDTGMVEDRPSRITFFGDVATADVPPRVLPPRLLRPYSGSRVSSQRPTFRWVLPEGITRARVELCSDRPCARILRTLEVTGNTTRPEERLLPGVVFWRVRGLRTDGSITWTSATWEFEVGRRDAPNDISYGTIHDVNGDGFSDVIAGNNNHDRLEVYRGGPERLRPPEDLAPPIYRQGFAQEPALGDFDGDGLADLVGRGAWGNSDDLGPLYRFRGRLGVSMEPPTREERPLTRGLCNAGDVNGDGYLDMVRCGRTASLEWGGAVGARPLPTPLTPGCEGCAGTDLNGDGYADLVLSSGRFLELVPGGPDGATLGSRIELVPPTTTDYGTDLSAGGDLNGDDVPDFCVAQLHYVDCYAGTPSAYPLWPSLRTESPDPLMFGYTTIRVSMQGDYNGDGRCDLAFGHDSAYRRPPGIYGLIYVFNGHPETLIDRMSRVDLYGMDSPDVVAPYSNSLIGSDVSAGGDINGDGFDDLLVGAGHSGPVEVTEGRNNGAVDVFLGASGGLRREHRWRVDGRPGGTHWGPGLGSSVKRSRILKSLQGKEGES